MKTIKPQGLGVSHRVFEHRGASYLTVTILAYVALEEPATLLGEVELWRTAGPELAAAGALDLGMSKARGEVLVTGHCHVPGGEPAQGSAVRVKVGAIDKKLYVLGDRRWTLKGPSDPVPFTVMPITWERAYGGEGHPENPKGRGAGPAAGDGQKLLPNIEDPAHLIVSARDRPRPAGLSPQDLTTPERTRKLGTHDAAWLRDLYPGFAADLDWSVFNAAPLDQQLEGYFRGDEPVVIENMHPERPRIESKLPGVAARCLIGRRGGETPREIATRLDTVHLVPHLARAILLFRGVTRIAEDDADDVLWMLAALERAAAPKPASHYQDVAAARLDRKQRGLAALRDSDLMPDLASAKATRAGGSARAESRFRENLRRGAERELERAKAEIRARGLNPSLYLPESLPPDAPVSDPEDLDSEVETASSEMERLKATAEAKRAEAEAEMARVAARNGRDPNVIAGRSKQGGPPDFSAARELVKLQDLATLGRNAGAPFVEVESKLADPTLATQLQKMEAQLRDAYRRVAHLQPPAQARDEHASRGIREALVSAVARGESLAEIDLTGVDLEGIDLRGADLARAMMERVNLEGADLSGANLSGAVLSHARLDRIRLVGARMAGANLGGASLVEADMSGEVELSNAVLAKADLTRATLRSARLEGADLSETRFDATDLRDVNAKGLTLLGGDLRGARLGSANLERASMVGVQLEGVDLSGARLAKASFIEVKGDGAVLRKADLSGAKILKGSSFRGASFAGATVVKACLRGTCLSGADFEEASLDGSDLSGCDLSRARLYRATARGALFIRADFTDAMAVSINAMTAIFQKATLTRADFRGANLFRADLAKALADEPARFDDALLTQARILERSRHAAR